jgi:UDP-3-O-[3-hydroxymyristoyl] glucosamine N-acyltransferase
MATATSSSNGHAANGTTIGPLSRSLTLGEIARLLEAELIGDESTLITGFAGLDATFPGAISFIEHDRLLPTALTSSASAIIAPASMAEQMRKQASGMEKRRAKPIVFTGNPRLAFAKVMELMQPVNLPEIGIHPTAIIESDAHIGEGVSLREYCYIGHHAHIGDGAVVYPHVYVGDGAQVGAASVLFPSVVIGHHTHIGRRVRVHAGSVIGGDGFGYVFDGHRHHKMPQVGTVIVDDDVEIGCNVTIDRATMGATRVGEGTKIDNLVQIAHNVQIGRDCIICGLAGISGSVVVEDNVVVAGQVGIRDHTKLGKGAVLGAKCGVMNDIAPGEFVLGSPAIPQSDFMKMQASSRKLPEMARQLRRLEKLVGKLQGRLDELEKPAED